MEYKLSFAPICDERTPGIPDNNYLRAIINERFPYPTFKPGVYQPTLMLGKYINIESGADTTISGSVVHALDLVEMSAAKAIVLSNSVVAGTDISLSAKTIRIIDVDSDNLRPAIRALSKLVIKAELLEIDGANILQPQQWVLNVGRIVMRNSTKNSSWLVDIIKQHNNQACEANDAERVEV